MSALASSEVCKASLETAVGVLNPMALLSLFLLLSLAFFGDGEGLIPNLHLNFLPLHFGQFRFDEVLLIVLDNVHARHPIGQSDALPFCFHRPATRHPIQPANHSAISRSIS